MKQGQQYENNECASVPGRPAPGGRRLLLGGWQVCLGLRQHRVVPLGPNSLASYAAGVRAALRALLPPLLGADPTQLKVLNSTMDYHLKGHPYVKSGVDMACRAILGKVGNCTPIGPKIRKEILDVKNTLLP